MAFHVDRCSYRQLFVDVRRLTIPSYQRDYDWGPRQFEAMWSDLVSHLRNRGDYFMGPINAERLPQKQGRGIELADGQQRLTTLFVILAAARPFLPARDRKRIEEVLSYQGKPRIDDQTPNSVLKRLLTRREEFGADEVVKFRQCRAFNFYIRKLKGKKPKEIRDLVDLVLDRVVFARVISTDAGSGAQMFERANTRGLQITLCDKVKSLMIGSAKPSDVEEIKVIWANVVRDLRSAQRFDDSAIQSWLAAEYEDAAERPKGEAPYEIIERVVRKKSALYVCKRLAAYAEAVARVSRGRTPSGNRVNGSLENLKVFGKYRQLLTVLYAAHRMDEERFERIAEEVENTICVVAIVKAKPNYVEKHIPGLLLQLRSAHQRQRSFLLLLEGLKQLRNEYAKDFGETIVNGDFTELRREHRQMLWHLLNEHFARKFEERTRKPRKRRDGSAKVSEEHILPKSRNARDAKREYGYGALKDIHRFANLTPLEQNPNKGTKPFSEKKRSYGDSSFWMTKTMYRSPDRSERFRAGVKIHLPTYQKWNRRQLKRRAEHLHRLCAVVLNFDRHRVSFREWD